MAWSLMKPRPVARPSLMGGPAPSPYTLGANTQLPDAKVPEGVNLDPAALQILMSAQGSPVPPSTRGNVLDSFASGRVPYGVNAAGAMRSADATDQFFRARAEQAAARAAPPPAPVAQAPVPDTLESVRAQYEGRAIPTPTPQFGSRAPAPSLAPEAQLAQVAPVVAPMMAPAPAAQPASFEDPNFQAVTPGSGRTAQATETSTNSNTHQQTTSQRTTAEELKDWEKILMGSDAYKDQVAGSKELERMLAMQGQRPAKMDLTPLFALADHLTGGDMAKSYKGPGELEFLNRKMLMDQASKLQDDKKDVFKSLQDSFSKFKTGSTTDSNTYRQQLMDMLKIEDVKSKRAAAATDQEIRWASKIQDNMRSDKEIQDPLKSLRALKTARSLINQGNPVADKSFKIFFQRAMGDDRISNFDIQNAGGSPDFAGRASQTISTLMDGTFDPKNRALYKEALDAIEKVQRTNLQEGRNRYIAQGVTTFKFDPDKAEAIVMDGSREPSPEIPDPTKKITDKASAEMHPEKRKVAIEKPAALLKNPNDWSKEDQAAIDAYEKALQDARKAQ